MAPTRSLPGLTRPAALLAGLAAALLAACAPPPPDAIEGTRRNMLEKVLDAERFPFALIRATRSAAETNMRITFHIAASPPLACAHAPCRR